MLTGPAKSFLDFCRVEKGLAANTLESYRLDLTRFSSELPAQKSTSPEGLSRYVESLYSAGLSARSIARHITTLRNFYSFLTREGEIERDPTEFLSLPRQVSSLPKYLNREEIERLLVTPPARSQPARRCLGDNPSRRCSWVALFKTFCKISLSKSSMVYGMAMPSWYDIKALSTVDTDQDEAGMLKCR